MSIKKVDDVQTNPRTAQTEQSTQTAEAPKIVIKFDKDAENPRNPLEYYNQFATEKKKQPDLWDSYVNGWKEDFAGVSGGGGQFINAAVNRTRKGFKSLDVINPLTYAKIPFKAASEKIDKIVDDGNPENLTALEKGNEFIKGAGDLVDYFTTTEGLWVGAATALGLETLGAGAAAAAPRLAKTLKRFVPAAMGLTGTGMEGVGLYNVYQAETKEDARAAGETTAAGAMFVQGANAMGLQKKRIAKAATENEVKPIDIKIKEKFTEADIIAMKTNDLIGNDVKRVLDEAFTKMNVPEAARPKLEVIGKLRDFSEYGIEEKFTKLINSRLKYDEKELSHVRVFKPGESVKDMTDEQLVERFKLVIDEIANGPDPGDLKALTSNPKRKMYTISNDELTNFVNKSETKGGSYNQGKHEIVFNADKLRDGTYKSIEEVAVHEATHAENAILRHMLAQSEADEIVKDALLSRIQNGEAEEIISSASLFGAQMMKPPKLSPKMKNDFSKFAQEVLYDKNFEYANDLDSYNRNKYLFKSSYSTLDEKVELSKKIAELEPKIKPFLDKVRALLTDNPEFVELNGGRYDDALDLMLQYCESHNIRYRSFSNNKIDQIKDVKFEPLTKEEHARAAKSLQGYIETIEGNSRISGFNAIFGATKEQFNQYQFSFEELLARNNAANFEKTKLLQNLNSERISDIQKTNISKRLEEIEFQLEYNKVGEQYYKAYGDALNNPENADIIKNLRAIEKEFIVLDNKKKGIMPDGTTADEAKIKTYEYIYEFKFPWAIGVVSSAFVDE